MGRQYIQYQNMEMFERGRQDDGRQYNGQQDDGQEGDEQDDDPTFEVPPKEAKAAFSKGFQSIRRSTNLLHCIAFVGAAVAIGINVGNLYGWDLGSSPAGLSSDNAIKLMLLPAKFLDVFIIASFSAVVLQILIKRLQSHKGVPLGLLGSGYQIGNMHYLFNGGVWKAARSFDEGPTDKKLALVLISAIIYGGLIGWSCNAVLTPRLAWWSDSQKTVYNTTLHPYLNAGKSQLYPNKLGAPNTNLTSGCDTASYGFTCPGAAFVPLSNWTTAWAAQSGMPSLSMTETISQARRSVTFGTKGVNGSSNGNYSMFKQGQPSNVTTGTTIPQTVLELTTLFWEYIYSSPGMEVNQIIQPKLTTESTKYPDSIAMPYVQVQCAVYDYSLVRQQSSGVYFPTDVLDSAPSAQSASAGSNGTSFESRSFNRRAVNSTLPNGMSPNGTSSNVTSNIQWSIDPSYWDISPVLDAVNFTWIDVSQYPGSNGSGASIGALFTLPRANNGSTSKQGRYLVPCLVNAKWASATVEYEGLSSAKVAGTPDLSKNTSIAISPQWASLLNVASTTKGNSSATSKASWSGTMLQSLVQPFITRPQPNPNSNAPSSDPTTISDVGLNAIPYLLTGVLTEGLARQAYDWNWPMLVFGSGQDRFSYTSLAQNFAYNKGQSFDTKTLDSSVDAANNGALLSATPFDFHVERFGYGWGPQWNDTRKTAVDLMGCVVLIVYLVIILAHLGASWWSFSLHSWHRIEEMLALALVAESKREKLGHGASVNLDRHRGQRMRVWLKERPPQPHDQHRYRRLELWVGEQEPTGLKTPKPGRKYA